VKGVVTRARFDEDLDEDTESVHVFVHDTKPPFLDSKIIWTKLKDPVLPVKDPTSDIAVLARKGYSLHTLQNK
jgi:pre-mRNA-splicing factor ATP-dependent RNA helicase DHX38/PRP16